MTFPLPLAIVGNVNVDLVLGPVAPWPLAGSEVVVDRDELRIGGSATNSALALRAFGAGFQLAANTGDDIYGRWMREGLAPHSATWPLAEGASTVSVGITHPNGERTFLTTRGHLPALTWAQVEAMLDWERLAGGWLLLCGSFLTDALTRDYGLLFDRADLHGIRVALDTGWPTEGWTESGLARARAWIARSGALLVNEVEAASLAGGANGAAALGALRAMMDRPGLVVIKRGPDGALLMTADGQVLQAPAPRVDVLDTIGAGDVFNAAFLHALAQGRDPQAALELGVNTASLAVSTSPRRYLPD
jgi:sugar/nucleoside kinase (ribokinase family)